MAAVASGTRVSSAKPPITVSRAVAPVSRITRPMEMKISEKPRKNSKGSSSAGRAARLPARSLRQGRQRGGLRFAENSGSDGGAKIFWGHLGPNLGKKLCVQR
jgi:hypothetical protein